MVTEVTVRLMRTPPEVRTMLLDFPTVRAAGEAVGGIIAAGVIPAAMEMMDRRMTAAVEQFVHADLPVDAAAVLLVEVDGTPAEVAAHTAVVEGVGHAHGARAGAGGARRGRAGAVLEGAQERLRRRGARGAELLPPRLRGAAHAAGRGARAHRARSRAEHDLIVMNVFHAGDGNLHPLIAFDRRDAEQVERVHAAGKEIIEACVAVGGVLSGEHGIGLEKRDFMPLTFDAVSLDAQACARDAFDPEGRLNPAQGPADRQPLRRAGAGRRVAAARHLAVTEVLSPASPAGGGRGAGRGERGARASVGVVGGGTRSRRGRPGPAPDRELRTAGLRRRGRPRAGRPHA